MRNEIHPVEQEEVMAYLDGEVPTGRGARIAAHLEQCAECRALAVELRGLSAQMMSWSVETAPAHLIDNVRSETGKAGPTETKMEDPDPVLAFLKRALNSRWTWAAACAFVVVLIVLKASLPKNDFMILPSASREALYLKMPQSTAAGGGAGGEAETVPGPLIARTASLKILVKDFAAARTGMDRILYEHGGYAASMNVESPSGAAQSLAAELRVPSPQCDAALAELRSLGRVEQEQQGGEEVTSQVVDIDARLKNARETEARLDEILRTRTGKIGDVLDVEKEMATFRGEIEQMEAEKKQLQHRIAFAAISLELHEQFQASLELAPGSPLREVRNALVDGYHSAVDGFLGVCVFFLNVGPSLILWGAILFWPARWAWRHWRENQAPRISPLDSKGTLA